MQKVIIEWYDFGKNTKVLHKKEKKKTEMLIWGENQNNRVGICIKKRKIQLKRILREN